MADDWVTDPGKLTVAGLLLAAVAAFARVLVVPAPLHNAIVSDLKQRLVEKQAECDQWRALALDGRVLAKQAEMLTERSVRVAAKAKPVQP